MTKISGIEGISDIYAQKLTDIGIATVEALLEQGASRKGRRVIAEKADIAEKMVLKWVNRADLARIKGIGEEYADLLEVAGVDTVPELGKRNAEILYFKIEEVNAKKKLVNQLPEQSKVEDWIKQAKGLDRVVTY
jgi:predicted flap endonuclease-1-like 5' DNA nuclease